MQMTIGQMPSGSVQLIASTGGAPSGEAAQVFGGLLAQAAGGTAEAGAANHAVLGKAIAAGLVSGDLAALLAGATGEGIESKLDRALQLLQGETAAEGGQDEAGLADVLNELSALLMSLFGFVPVKTAEAADNGSQTSGEGVAEAAVDTGDSVRSQLVQTLSFLKTFLQESGSNALGKEQLAILNARLDRLQQPASDNDRAAGMQQAESKEGQPDAKPNGTANAAGPAAQPNPGLIRDGNRQADARAKLSDANPNGAANVTVQAAQTNLHLVRMGNQPLQPSLLKTVIAEAEAETGKAATAGADEIAMDAAFDGLPTGRPDGAKPIVEGAKTQVPQPVPVNRFFETMTGMIVKQFGLTQANGVTEAKLLLMPEHLGQVDVRISLQNGQLTAQFVAENAAAKDMLENQLAQLRSSLQSQGLQVEKLEVSHGTQQSQMFQDGRHREHGGQAFRQQQGNRSGNAADGGMAGFEEELVDSAVRNGLGYGRAINITA
ncbi:MAG TPA: flagellar hook-length control protein FliK [Paenibacillus sp.]|uniref:flagellar hook-length control protein FliK n=1 Tax=Paenibacillus sp. TaxID=58172 RepID=UPI0028D67652|nr:flagellar hook-length control protein FliK [Paenibacillus sp.]HUC90970.1 flagellar hook-length control protein FliK [Paenibacillus sp.]